MYIKCKTLDDILYTVYGQILKSGRSIAASKGANRELTGVLLELKNPRARLSRSEKRGKLFSSIGELLWYLSGSNSVDFISYYIKKYRDFSDDGKTIHGGYGPRLFNMRGKYNQIEKVISLLTAKPTSRQAVIQLFDASDHEKTFRDIPCTCTLQFAIREKRVEMFTFMRSNDAFLGLPHDIFAFTMLQEIIARSLDVDIGSYKHFVSSLHIYDEHLSDANLYLKEGFQSSVAMPPIPSGNPWNSLKVVLQSEEKIRTNNVMNIEKLAIEPYWKDLILLLQIHHCLRNKQDDKISALKKKFSSTLYNMYVDGRQVNLNSIDQIKKKS